MKILIKNSFLGKHVFNENGKEVSQISSYAMNDTQNMLLIDQQKTYTFEKSYTDAKQSELKLQLFEEPSRCAKVLGTAELNPHDRVFYDLNVSDLCRKQEYHLYVNSDTSWLIMDMQQHIGTITKMDAYGSIQLECPFIDDLRLLCAFYLFTQAVMRENEALPV